MEKSPVKIYPETPHIILCEGADAYYFLIWLLDDAKKTDRDFADFRLYNFGGISELKKYLDALLKLDGFCDSIQSVTIIRDAEHDAQGACQSIRDALSKLNFACPSCPCQKATLAAGELSDIATGFLLFPDCSHELTNGTLEDLCLAILKQEDAPSVLAAVDTALKPYEEKGQLPRLHKNRLHSYFSFTDRYVSNKIGEAAKAHAFDFSAQSTQRIKDFLKEMHKGR